MKVATNRMEAIRTNKRILYMTPSVWMKSSFLPAWQQSPQQMMQIWTKREVVSKLLSFWSQKGYLFVWTTIETMRSMIAVSDWTPELMGAMNTIKSTKMVFRKSKTISQQQYSSWKPLVRKPSWSLKRASKFILILGSEWNSTASIFLRNLFVKARPRKGIPKAYRIRPGSATEQTICRCLPVQHSSSRSSQRRKVPSISVQLMEFARQPTIVGQKRNQMIAMVEIVLSIRYSVVRPEQHPLRNQNKKLIGMIIIGSAQNEYKRMQLNR